jgi:hypothetical protein
LASASEIVAKKMDTGGAASAMAHAVGSSMGVRRTGRVQEAGPKIASRRLPVKWQFSFTIFLHFLDLVLNHNGFIDHVLEIGVISVEQLELNVIIQPIQKHVLLLLIHIDVIWGVSGQLNE